MQRQNRQMKRTCHTKTEQTDEEDMQCLWSGSSWSILLFSCVQNAIEPFALLHHSVFDYLWCFTVMFHR